MFHGNVLLGVQLRKSWSASCHGFAPRRFGKHFARSHLINTSNYATLLNLIMKIIGDSRGARRHRCPVAVHRAAASRTAPAARPAGTPVAGFARRAERDPVGVAHGHAMVGDAGPLPIVSDLLSSISAMASSRRYASLLRALAKHLERRDEIKLDKCFVDGSFSVVKKGSAGVDKTKRGKGCNVMAIADRSGLPVALCTGSTSPHETRFVTDLIDWCLTPGRPERLIADKAYYSDPLDLECL